MDLVEFLDAHTPTEWTGPIWNDCGTCNWSRRTDSRGYGLRWCLWCERDARERMRTLAHNLAMAGGLCRAFTQGWNQNIHVRFGEEHRFWSPGCGRTAP